MLSGVGVVCFTASYAIAFLFEGIRVKKESLFLRGLALFAALAGLTAHTAYLFHHFILQNERLVVNAGGWFFVLAWGFVLLDLYLSFYYPKTRFGLILFPTVFLTIFAGFLLSETQFPALVTGRILRGFHGISLLMATFGFFCGFATGGMYFLQLAKLRRRSSLGEKMNLPSLEWLQKANRRAVEFSLLWLGGGIVSGLYMRHLNASLAEKTASVPLTDLMVAGAIFLFIILSAFLLILKKRGLAQDGKWLPLLTIFSFLFLAVLLTFGIASPRAHWFFVPGEGAASSVESELSPSKSIEDASEQTEGGVE